MQQEEPEEAKNENEEEQVVSGFEVKDTFCNLDNTCANLGTYR
jgi:hypothetical protein